MPKATWYYYAVQAYLDSSAAAGEEERTLARLGRWFDLTERHPQLRELSKQEYLSAKTKELANQKALQRSAAVPGKCPSAVC